MENLLDGRHGEVVCKARVRRQILLLISPQRLRKNLPMLLVPSIRCKLTLAGRRPEEAEALVHRVIAVKDDRR
jgi:hypothetical protein